MPHRMHCTGDQPKFEQHPVCVEQPAARPLHQPHPPARGAVPDLNGKRDRFRPAVDTATVLHRPDGRVLLLRRTEPAADRRLVLVGGALTGSEWADDSARRAVDAAVGVQVDASDVEYCGTAHLQVGDGERYLVLLFTAQRWRGEPRNAGSQGEVELVWAEPGEPPADCHPATAALLDLFVTGTLQTCLRVPATRERGTA